MANLKELWRKFWSGKPAKNSEESWSEFWWGKPAKNKEEAARNIQSAYAQKTALNIGKIAGANDEVVSALSLMKMTSLTQAEADAKKYGIDYSNLKAGSLEDPTSEFYAKVTKRSFQIIDQGFKNTVEFSKTIPGKLKKTTSWIYSIFGREKNPKLQGRVEINDIFPKTDTHIPELQEIPGEILEDIEIAPPFGQFIDEYGEITGFATDIPSDFRANLLATYNEINTPKPFKETLMDKLGIAKDFIVEKGLGIAMGLSSMIGGVQGLVQIIKKPAQGALGWIEKSLDILNAGLGLLGAGVGIISYPPRQSHTGGKISGREEILQILRGGETIRTQEEEQQLKEQRHQAVMEQLAPFFEEEEEDDYVPGRPVFWEQTQYDKDMIIHILSQAWRYNRNGFRNVLRYE